jgi:hypothetical protein
MIGLALGRPALEAWACRDQCADAASLTPVLFAVRLTRRLTSCSLMPKTSPEPEPPSWTVFKCSWTSEGISTCTDEGELGFPGPIPRVLDRRPALILLLREIIGGDWPKKSGK